MNKKISFLICIVFFVSVSVPGFTHSGRTDSNCGHNDNINGGYHYHYDGCNSGSSNSTGESDSEDLRDILLITCGLAITYIVGKYYIEKSSRYQNYVEKHNHNFKIVPAYDHENKAGKLQAVFYF